MHCLAKRKGKKMGILSLFRSKPKKDFISFEGGPGDCKKNAVVIHAPNHILGVIAEYQYVGNQCGGSKPGLETFYAISDFRKRQKLRCSRHRDERRDQKVILFRHHKFLRKILDTLSRLGICLTTRQDGIRNPRYRIETYL